MILLGKKRQISVALFSISLGVFVVAWALSLSCPNNENVADQAWREMGQEYCIYAQNVNQFLTNFVDFMRNFTS